MSKRNGSSRKDGFRPEPPTAIGAGEPSDKAATMLAYPLSWS